MATYLKRYFLFLGMLTAIHAMPLIYLYQSGEYLPLHSVVAAQLESRVKIIYGSALHDNRQQYKVAMLDAVEPEVLVVGSSRVLLLRQSAFKSPMVNLGGSVNGVEQGHDLLNQVIAKKPELVILGADIWWFNDQYVRSSSMSVSLPRSDLAPKPRDPLQVIVWLLTGKIAVSEMASSRGSLDIGIAGRAKDGFGPDGSYYYTRVSTGKRTSGDIGFLDTFRRIGSGERRFEYGHTASRPKIDRFIELLEELEKNGIHVVVIFPPFATQVVKRLRSSRRYGYIRDLKDVLKEKGLGIYDYSDTAKLGSTDCEFVDGFHGGEITYLRILKDIAERDQIVNAHVDLNYVQTTIDKYSGRAFVYDPDITSDPEIDFLRLGCQKYIVQE